MRLELSDFRDIALKDKIVKAIRIVKYTPESKRLELVMNGAVFNRSNDKEYVLDNVKERATHVDMAEHDAFIKRIYPEILEITQDADIDLPPDQFYLMQDLYQLPDSGDWNTQKEVPASEIEIPQYCEHMLIHTHRGTLIDNTMINSLRRRTSYVLKEGKYVRSRDNNFRVRRRPKEIMIVVDDEKTKDLYNENITINPKYRVSFYVIKEAGVSIKLLDKGDVEHIGIIRHLIDEDIHPDIILFEPKRQKQLAKTETTIIQNNTRISSKFRFKGVKCGELDIGSNTNELHTELLKFCEEVVNEIKGGDTSVDHSAANTRSSELTFNIKTVSHSYYQICKKLGFDDDKIKTKVNGYVLKASQLVMQLVGQKFLKSIHKAEAISRMTKEEKTAEVNKYMSNFPTRVSEVRSSILYELLLKDSLTLHEVSLKNDLGDDGEAFIKKSREEMDSKTVETLRNTYYPSAEESISDDELKSLYQRDFSKYRDSELLKIFSIKLGFDIE
ncbi:MAG: hypothetical protein ACYTFY_01095 [Planctomycetota bacterium]|jgi:hypothetical protein